MCFFSPPAPQTDQMEGYEKGTYSRSKDTTLLHVGDATVALNSRAR